MIQLTAHMLIMVCHQPIDFRKGIDGIMRICRDYLDRDPFTGTLFVFRNRQQNGIKILVYDGQGFWLCHKRFSKGHFKKWPTDLQGRSSEIFAFDLQVLLAGGEHGIIQTMGDWKKINLTENKSPCVPEEHYNLLTHGNTTEISRSGDHQKRGGVYPKPNSRVPGLQ